LELVYRCGSFGWFDFLLQPGEQAADGFRCSWSVAFSSAGKLEQDLVCDHLGRLAAGLVEKFNL